ncbi:MAG: response regulator [Deltaproteobacteria bacterium]|nr:response regulator [Deltaproteobacteria bacterium]
MSGLMVVDDEEGVRRSLRKILEKEGYRIVLAQNGEEALNHIRNDGREIEIVISDYRMPGMDGLETLIAIGRMNAEITRIMLTGYATMASAIDAVNAGIDGFLTKPFGNEELIAKVREYSIKKRLKQFIPEQVLVELQKNEKSVLPKKMQVTILFSDIRGFTALAERLSPVELSELLNERYFTPLDDVLFNFDGTLDKHIGDSIMGIFGAPLSGKEDALRAVKAALAMRAEIVRTNEGILDPEKRINVGFGIATGEVVCGILGSPRKKEYSALGATVNLASRLEKLAREEEILICDETAQWVKDAIAMEKVEGLTIRGFARPHEIFSVQGEKKGNRP